MNLEGTRRLRDRAADWSLPFGLICDEPGGVFLIVDLSHPAPSSVSLSSDRGRHLQKSLSGSERGKRPGAVWKSREVSQTLRAAVVLDRLGSIPNSASPPGPRKPFGRDGLPACRSDGQKVRVKASWTSTDRKLRLCSPTDLPRSSSRNATNPRLPTSQTG